MLTTGERVFRMMQRQRRWDCPRLESQWRERRGTDLGSEPTARPTDCRARWQSVTERGEAEEGADVGCGESR